MTLKTFIVSAGLCCVATFVLVSCEQEATILPGHSRPLLEHDWPHPRDFTFEPSSFRPPAPETARLEAASGLRAYVIADASDPLVRVTAAIPIGRFYEREGEAGASEALTRVLTSDSQGSPPLSLRLESLGTQLDAELDVDGLTLSVEVLSEDWEQAIRVMIDLLRNRRVERATLGDFRTGPGFASPTAGVTGRGFQPKVELERRLGGYPLSPPEPGIAVRLEAVRALASRSLAPNRFVVGIGGDVPRDEAVTLLEELTSGWELGEPVPDAAEPRELASRDGSGTLETIDVDTLEGWVAIGRGLGPVPADERAPLAVLGQVLGTRLNISVREIRGLANRATFFLPETMNGAGLLHISTGGRPEAVAPLIKYCREEMAALHRNERPVTEEELALAKGILRLGKWQESLDGARRAAAAYALATLHDGDTGRLLSWPKDVEAVSADQVEAVAKKYLDPRTMDTVVIGPIERIREARHPRWPADLDALSSVPK
jgi:zinc protease